ncbi:MAG: NUDIX domain-containing protein [Alphaproteobacteria bacterium]|nr:NUDIX domain-containing protein [Alphaproteobacteria bacterium]
MADLGTKFSERFRIVGGVLVLIFDADGRVLMMLRNNKFDAGTYSVPGGCMEAGEAVTSAGAREILEETGLIVAPENLHIVSVLNRITPSGWQSVEFVVVAKSWAGTPEIKEPNKCSELKWFETSALPHNISKYAETAIKNYKSGIMFSEIDY